MRRKIAEQLLQWKNQTDRGLLLLDGARQVGKTYSVQKFGAEYFENMVYIDFENDKKIRAHFHVGMSRDSLLQFLERYGQAPLVPGKTLIIFDEVQLCENAFAVLNEFADASPEYYAIAVRSRWSGNAVCGAETVVAEAFAENKIWALRMYPMDFEEYLWAKDKMELADRIRAHFEMDVPLTLACHQEAMEEYYQYCIGGGLPEVVAYAAKPENRRYLMKSHKMQKLLLDSYIADMLKYSDASDTLKIYGCYNSLPLQFTKDLKKFQYRLIKTGGRASQYASSIDWLAGAGIVEKSVKCIRGQVSLEDYMDSSSFRLYFHDMGIMAAQMGITISELTGAENVRIREIVQENYVACALRMKGYQLFYWESDGTAQVDFLIQKEGYVIPADCRIGANGKAKSLMVYREKYQPPYAIQISEQNFGVEKGIKMVPVYAVFCI